MLDWVEGLPVEPYPALAQRAEYGECDDVAGLARHLADALARFPPPPVEKTARGILALATQAPPDCNLIVHHRAG